MLEGLETVNWSDLAEEYPSAEMIPEWLVALTSSDRNTRDEAYGQLVEILQHQGSVYKTTVYAIPFLIQLLASDRVPETKRLFRFLLGAVASETDYIRVQEIDDWGFYRLHEYAIQATVELQKGMDVYAALLDHPSSEVRLDVAILLSALYRDPDADHDLIRRLFRSRAAREDNKEVLKIIKSL